MLIFEFGLPEA